MASFQDFLDALGQRESSGDYKVVATFGYLGKYQFSEAALIDLGYYKGDKTNNGDYQDWSGAWTGKDGIRSEKGFLNSVTAQENAIREWLDLQWDYIKDFSLEQYVGRSIGGKEITVSGMLAGSHLGGITNLAEYLKGKGKAEFVDPYGTKISDYLTEFAFYDTPFTTGGEDLLNA
jgi:serralysin